MKNIFKNYKFYIIVASMLCIIAIKLLDVMGVQVTTEVVQNIIAYILSALIAYNVITIDKPKKQEDIKKDIQVVMQTMQSKTKNKDTEQKTNATTKTNSDISRTIQ